MSWIIIGLNWTVSLKCLEITLDLIYKLKPKLKICTVVWWLAPPAHNERDPGSIPTWGLSVWSLHVLPVYVTD